MASTSLPDMLRGSLTILFIMVVAGGVAYVGDRVGHQVGRRRLTLYGIRPRHTSTIVAVATGMLIAFIVTLGAIFASQQVKTAFFKLDRINQEISTLQDRQKVLEKKVNTGRLAVPADSLMVPLFIMLQQTDSSTERFAKLKSFYAYTENYVNGLYPRFGLKPFKTPPDIDARIRDRLDDPAVQAALAQADIVVTATNDQNLFVGDPVEFRMNLTPDVRRITKGEVVAQLTIPGGRSSARLALTELQTLSANFAHSRQLPDFIANLVTPVQSVPSDLTQMQAMLDRPGTYLMTAYAVEDIYPHTIGVPIIVVLVPQPK